MLWRASLQVIWAPLLGALSTLFDEYHDPRLVTLCLQGFVAGACLTAQVRLGWAGHTHTDLFGEVRLGAARLLWVASPVGACLMDGELQPWVLLGRWVGG